MWAGVHGILQARILEWVAMPSSRGSFWQAESRADSFLLRHQGSFEEELGLFSRTYRICTSAESEMKVEPKSDNIFKETEGVHKPMKHRMLNVKQLLEI